MTAKSENDWIASWVNQEAYEEFECESSLMKVKLRFYERLGFALLLGRDLLHLRGQDDLEDVFCAKTFF